MTKQEKLRLVDMANSDNINDRVLCIEILNNNLDCFTSNEVHCLAILCSRDEMYAGISTDRVRPLISKWCDSIKSEWGNIASGKDWDWFVTEYKRLLNLNEIKMKEVEIR